MVGGLNGVSTHARRDRRQRRWPRRPGTEGRRGGGANVDPLELPFADLDVDAYAVGAWAVSPPRKTLEFAAPDVAMRVEAGRAAAVDSLKPHLISNHLSAGYLRGGVKQRDVWILLTPVCVDVAGGTSPESGRQSSSGGASPPWRMQVRDLVVGPGLFTSTCGLRRTSVTFEKPTTRSWLFRAESVATQRAFKK